jgi:hypothetical protein
MIRFKWLIATALLVLMAGMQLYFGHVSALGAAQKPPSTFDQALIDKRIQEIQPTAKEKRFDEIGWAKGILEAERLAKENNRPVFLFCNVGEMELGRC